MKKIFLILIGGIVVFLLILFDNYTRAYFNNNDRIVKNLNLLKQKELKLNYEIFTISVYLYKNFDPIVKLENDIDNILDNLTNDVEFQKKKQAYKDFLEYKKDIKAKINKIYELETIIAPLKNADMYTSELINKLPISSLPPKDRRLWLNIASNIFLSKSSLDETFIKNINKKLEVLKKIQNSKFNEIFVKNVELINNLFPLYVKEINNVANSKTLGELKKCFDDFLVETNQKLKIITIVSILLIIFVVISILSILFLFISLEKENEVLEKISITDDLTQLYNRRKLQMDIEKDKVLFIINIDRFKYYNDLYGIEVGDYILQDVAKKITYIFPKQYNPKFYRLGADDFAVLCDRISSDDELLNIGKDVIKYISDNSISYHREIEFHIMVSIGISYVFPLVETADIILKKIKKDTTTNIDIYNPILNEKENWKDNMRKVSILKKAIENDAIIPYYQPIISNKTDKIIKYEVLARIEIDNKIFSIYPFLTIAKENRDYKYITISIYKKAFEQFKDKQIEFSLNLSIDDIENEKTMMFLYSMIEKYPEVFKYITFEILEDDAINNYDELKKFIELVKKYGSKIAVDDFGSGYSNFAHILNLDIDYLKIDGSLIKNLIYDKKMELIVETIVDFSNKTNIEVIAEFVHNEIVLQKVKQLGIEYSQGYYLGEPSRDIV